MPPTDLRLFNPNGPDRVAVVSVEPAYGRTDAFLLRLARGPKAGKLPKGSTFGPYAEAELPARFNELVASLRAEGFGPSGLQDLLAKLFDAAPAVRGRAALRLGWMGRPEAVDALLAAMPKAVDDL